MINVYKVMAPSQRDVETWNEAIEMAAKEADRYLIVKWLARDIRKLKLPIVGTTEISAELDAAIDEELANKPKDIMK